MTRKLKLRIEVELDVTEGTTDREVYEAICVHFAGRGDGLTLDPGDENSKVVASGHDLYIYKSEESIYGSTM